MSKLISAENNKEYTIALLIDAENISYKYMEALLEQLKAFGKITIRRVYGDFTGTLLQPWKKICNELSIRQIHANMISPGKNNSDSALIIDAMDILHDQKADAFCLATSDSDFTSLAIRIREEGYFVVGAGEEKTTKAFIETCDRFIKLGNSNAAQKKARSAREPSKANTGKEKVQPPAAKPALSADQEKKIEEIKARSYLIMENRGEGNYVQLSVLINDLYRYYPDFNVKEFGFKTNKDFFLKLGFDVSQDEKHSLVIR